MCRGKLLRSSWPVRCEAPRYRDIFCDGMASMGPTTRTKQNSLDITENWRLGHLWCLQFESLRDIWGHGETLSLGPAQTLACLESLLATARPPWPDAFLGTTKGIDPTIASHRNVFGARAAPCILILHQSSVWISPTWEHTLEEQRVPGQIIPLVPSPKRNEAPRPLTSVSAKFSR